LNVLKKKYRTILLKYHPDKQNYSKEISNILFAEVSNIYEMFLDSVKLHMDCDNTEYNLLEKKYKKLNKQYYKLIHEYNKLQNKMKMKDL
jgi:hypothetical protein